MLSSHPARAAMKFLVPCLLALALAFSSLPVAAETVETLVCFRHGEKPPEGLGQLDCRGLNRSLALPKVLLSKFGRPRYIFAPDPAEKVGDPGGDFYYVRPLATVEPTAIYLGMPVQTPFGFTHTRELEEELMRPRYHNATVFISWEHKNLRIFVKRLIENLGGNGVEVPEWHGSDYDSIYVVKITRAGTSLKVSFQHDYEHLNGLSETYPSIHP